MFLRQASTSMPCYSTTTMILTAVLTSWLLRYRGNEQWRRSCVSSLSSEVWETQAIHELIKSVLTEYSISPDNVTPCIENMENCIYALISCNHVRAILLVCYHRGGAHGNVLGLRILQLQWIKETLSSLWNLCQASTSLPYRLSASPAMILTATLTLWLYTCSPGNALYWDMRL